MIRRTCEQCSQTFDVFPSDIRRGWGRFCSRQCAGLARSMKITLCCAQCGEKFQVRPSKSNRIYCSAECYGISCRLGEWYKCLACGKEFYASRAKIREGGGKYCSRKCNTRGEHNPAWKGGRRIRNGYAVTWTDVGMYRFEHRIVMEEMLGRPLTSNEIVHHVNGDSLDNNPKNLRVMMQSEHMSLHRREQEAARETE